MKSSGVCQSKILRGRGRLERFNVVLQLGKKSQLHYWSTRFITDCIFMYVCMYVCVCVCMHVRMYVCLYVCVCIYVCMYLSVCVICICKYANVYADVIMWIRYWLSNKTWSFSIIQRTNRRLLRKIILKEKVKYYPSLDYRLTFIFFMATIEFLTNRHCWWFLKYKVSWWKNRFLMSINTIWTLKIDAGW